MRLTIELPHTTPVFCQENMSEYKASTIVPTKLAVKLSDLSITSSLCDWIQDFLTGRPQVVKVGQFTSNSFTLDVGAPQGCVLNPLLYSLYTHDCVSSHSSTSIVRFADDTVVLGLINNNDEATYLNEVERLTSWCQDNCLSLKVSKTKELIVDFRKRQQRPYTPLMISGTPVESQVRVQRGSSPSPSPNETVKTEKEKNLLQNHILNYW